ncbi:hypothetical protein D623_10016473 [Myotis brandtii]|uniref:Uncharacterized protein n=1 Tax=Myotis brandtii TaxID=109478 RepID=S7MZH8_MYOBR|nr:hypothetical protein D623_10016473 [Myotis brandtii]
MSPSAFPCGTWGHVTSSGGTAFPFTTKRPVGGPACQSGTFVVDGRCVYYEEARRRPCLSGTFVVDGRCELFPKMSHHEDKGTPSCLQ